MGRVRVPECRCGCLFRLDILERKRSQFLELLEYSTGFSSLQYCFYFHFNSLVSIKIILQNQGVDRKGSGVTWLVCTSGDSRRDFSGNRHKLAM